MPAQRLFTVSTLVGVRGTKPGTTFIVRSETSTHDGKPVVTQYSTCSVRGAAPENSHGETAAGAAGIHEKCGAVVSRYALTPDQTRRYADAARDYSGLHDRSRAAAAKVGYAAPLVHGMLTLLAAQGHRRRSLRRRDAEAEAARLPLCPSAAADARPDAQGRALERPGGPIGFEASDKDGNIVIRNGYAEVSK